MRIYKHVRQVVLLFVVTGGAVASAIQVGQVDDFQDGTVMNWSEGGGSPNPPANLADSGPAGTGDHALRNVSSGGNGPGSRMLMFNTAQWSGDYLAAGVEKIDVSLKAASSSAALNMRIAINSGVTWYASQNAFVLPNDNQWRNASFPLDASDLTLIQGTDSLQDVLQNVTQLRLLSAAQPNFRGDQISATLFVDDIAAGPTCVELISTGSGIAADLSGPEGQPDCRVDIFDLVALAGSWLDCISSGCL